MKIFFFVVVVISGVGLSWWGIARWQFKRAQVSPDWLIDNERRCWGSGVDQPSMAWPINKIRDDHAGFNTRRLRNHG